MAPVFAKNLFPKWRTPVDLGAELGGIGIFGSNKTWRGLIAGVFGGALAAAALVALGSVWPDLARATPEASFSTVLVGAWLGLWALLGDLVKSFFKRRMRIH